VGRMKKHKCRNPKFCPICGQKRKVKIIKFFKSNPNIDFSYKDIMNRFELPYETTRSIIKNLELRGMITKKYRRTKRMTVGSGVKTHLTFSTTNLDLMRSKFNHG